jgi:phosphate transport system protein
MTGAHDSNVHFHNELDALEQTVLGAVLQAEEMVGMAVRAVTTGDLALAARVVTMDEAMDATYFQVHNDWTGLMARFQPLGSDLRRMTVLLQLNITFERMGDQCVNIAKTALKNAGLPHLDRISDQLQEMADLVRPMIRTALDAYIRQDLDEARLLPSMDDPVDRLNANLYKDALEVGNDHDLLEWATSMLLVARALERVGDQAVDFAEQTVYLVTGDRMSFELTGLTESDHGSVD